MLEIGTGSDTRWPCWPSWPGRSTRSSVPELAASARAVLDELGHASVHLMVGDGHAGWPSTRRMRASTAAPDAVPPALLDQLAVGGRLVIPVGPRDGPQQLRILTRTDRGVTEGPSLLSARTELAASERGPA
ncbi:MAG: hypothetical protein R2712_15985 [Vicinamibacterales bacterium]